MKTNFRRWLPAIVQKHPATVGLATLAVAAGLVGGAASAAAAPETPESATAVANAAPKSAAAPASAPVAPKVASGKAQPAPKPVRAKAAIAPKAAKAPSTTKLKHRFQLQPNIYFCGPAATRVALSAHGKVYDQYRVARMLGTTVNGTNSSYDVTRVLNKQLGKGRYHTVEIGGQKATPRQIKQLKADIVSSLSSGDVLVANIIGAATDDNGEYRNYPVGHYLPIVGYSNNGNTVKIADSFDKKGSPYYTMSTTTLAHWIASRGYSAS